MSLERRIADALHRADDYEPSADLFSRLSRSIEEDKDHRRRLLFAAASVVIVVVAVVALLVEVTESSSEGPTTPSWAIELVAAGAMLATLVSLGPALRRLGGPLLDDVFHLSPETGAQFARLLDIAYYLFFAGLIVGGLDFRDLDSMVLVTGDETRSALTRVSGFLLQLGLAHVAILVVLPVVSLLFTSTARRALRNAAGADRLPPSPRAQQADRIARVLTNTVVALLVGGLLALIGFLLLAVGLP